MRIRKPKLSPEILEQASSWFVDFNEGEADRADREEFSAWLRTSPEHVRAYLQISAFWEDAKTLGKHTPDLDVLIDRAKAEHNIVTLELERGRIGDDETKRPSRGAAFKLLYTLAACTLTVAIVSVWLYTLPKTYRTEIGEQRSITLEDGSRLELNARSRLQVRFSDKERAIELLEGQALFKVAKNPGRPFVVRSGSTLVRAVGTQFDVYRKASGTVVTVLEGRVAVKASQGGSAVADASTPAVVSAAVTEMLLGAGEQLTVTPTAITSPKPADTATAIAWTEQKLIFDSTPLREVVEEFNRYNRTQLVIQDSTLYDYHVSGVFPSTDPNRIVEFLRQRFGVSLSRDGDQIQITRRPTTEATTT
jgi:transmembrane sensor